MNQANAGGPQDIVRLMTAYAQARPDQETRLAAAIAAAASPEAFASLVKMVNDKNPQTRAKAARLLPQLPEWRRQRALAEALLDDPEPAVSRPMLQAAAQQAPAAFIPWLRRRAGDADADSRALCLRALIATGDPAHADALLARLPFEADALRQEIWGALVAMIKRDPADMTERMIRVLAAPDPEARRAAADLLAKMPDKRDVLRRLLIYAESLGAIPRDAAFAAMKKHAEAFAEPLLALFQGEDAAAVRLQGLALARALGHERLTPLFLHQLKSPDWTTRAAALQTLGAMKAPQALPVLVEMLGRGQDAAAVVQALDRYRDPRLAKPLFQRLPAADEAEQIDILKALKNLGDARFLPHLAKFLESASPKGQAKKFTVDAIVDLCRANGQAVPPRILEIQASLSQSALDALPDLGLKLAGD